MVWDVLTEFSLKFSRLTSWPMSTSLYSRVFSNREFTSILVRRFSSEMFLTIFWSENWFRATSRRGNLSTARALILSTTLAEGWAPTRDGTSRSFFRCEAIKCFIKLNFANKKNYIFDKIFSWSCQWMKLSYLNRFVMSPRKRVLG